MMCEIISFQPNTQKGLLSKNSVVETYTYLYVPNKKTAFFLLRPLKFYFNFKIFNFIALLVLYFLNCCAIINAN